MPDRSRLGDLPRFSGIQVIRVPADSGLSLQRCLTQKQIAVPGDIHEIALRPCVPRIRHDGLPAGDTSGDGGHRMHSVAEIDTERPDVDVVPACNRADVEGIEHRVAPGGIQETGHLLEDVGRAEDGKTAPPRPPEAEDIEQSEQITAMVGMGMTDDDGRQIGRIDEIAHRHCNALTCIEQQPGGAGLDEIPRGGTTCRGIRPVRSDDPQAHEPSVGDPCLRASQRTARADPGGRTLRTMEALLAAALIFAARVADVSIGTIRIVALVQGRNAVAGVLGFFESAIWLLAASQVVTSLDSPIKLIGFAAGFGAGTALGGFIERQIGMGKALIRVISPHDGPAVAPVLREMGFGVTVLNAEGVEGSVRLSFSVVPRRRISEALHAVRATNPNAYVTVERTSAPDLAHQRRMVRA